MRAVAENPYGSGNYVMKQGDALLHHQKPAKYRGKAEKVKAKTLKSEDSNTHFVRLTNEIKWVEFLKISCPDHNFG